MQRNRGELVPIGEVFGGLDGPVKAIREASPQALHHFTRFDQVDQLVGASEADPDLGFMARLMAPCAHNPASCSWVLRFPSSWASWAWLPSAALGPASAIR